MLKPCFKPGRKPGSALSASPRTSRRASFLVREGAQRRSRGSLRFALGLATVLAALLQTGCRDNPEIVFQQAREALKSKDNAAFLALVDAPSRAFLTRSQDVVRLSGQTYEVLGAKGFAPDLLPAGELVEDTEDGDYCLPAVGKLCVVQVKKGRNVVRVPLRLVRGQWRIAMLEMDSFLNTVLPR